jgi:hypothetical protein
MSLRMCDSGSSPFAWVEFSTHCSFCGADRIGTSWTSMSATPMRFWTSVLAGEADAGLVQGALDEAQSLGAHSHPHPPSIR